MTFPHVSDAERLRLLEAPVARASMVLDTDTDNEIDDQFALTYALLSPATVQVEAIYAAPYHNDRSVSPADGMERSYDEIVRVLDRLGRRGDNVVYKGSAHWMPGADQPVRSPAAEDLVARALAPRDGPLYVVAIGAVTNVASAILLEPEIIRRIVVVWLGGNASHWHTAREFNLQQDIHASRLLFDCGVPLVHVPCYTAAAALCTSQAELERYVKGRGPIGEYLYEIYTASMPDHVGRSRVIWDLAPVAWLVLHDAVDTVVRHSPVLTADCSWSHDPHRHLIREAWQVQRDRVFGDLFAKLEAHRAPK